MRAFDATGEVKVKLGDLVRSDEQKMERALLRAAEKMGLPVLHGKPHPGYEYQFSKNPADWSITISWRELEGVPDEPAHQ